MLLPEPSMIVRALLLGLIGAFAVGIEAAPLGLAPRAVPSPDLLACVVAAVAVRQPEAAPLLVVFALGAARDLVTDVPPGAGAASLVLLLEMLRARSATLMRRSLVTECVWVAGALLAMLFLQYFLVLLTLSQPPYLMEIIRQWALTAALYPVVAPVVRWGLGIRRRQGEFRGETGKR